MQDLRTHANLGSVPPQTTCGLPTFGHKVSDDPDRINCPDCVSILRRTNNPSNDAPLITKKARGRPRKEINS